MSKLSEVIKSKTAIAGARIIVALRSWSKSFIFD